MRITKAVVTAAGRSQRTLPLQTLIDRDGAQKPVLRIIVEEALRAGIEQLCVVICPGDESAYAGAAGELDVRCAGVLGDCDEIAQLVIQRYGEALTGDIRMNCDMCMYRAALPGFEHRVGAPQRPHYHPAEPPGALSPGRDHVH